MVSVNVEIKARDADPDATAARRQALGAALGETVVVVKRRRLFEWEHVRIHLDDVEGLGTFIELEAMVGPGLNTREEAAEKVARLRSELVISDDELVAVGYSDLLLDGVEALLRAADGVMGTAYGPYR